jgi:hypothetical protein
MCNDLVGAARHADEINRAALADIAIFVFHHCPSDCCGSPGAVTTWLAQKASAADVAE